MTLIFIPIIAASAQAVSLLVDRFTIKRLKVDFRVYSYWAFFYLTVLTFALQSWLGGWQPAAVRQEWPLIILTLILAPSWNYFFFKAVAHEKAINVESISSLAPILSIIGAWTAAPAEFRLPTALSIAVAVGFLLWGYSRRHRLALDSYLLLLIVAMALSALENLAITQVLASGAMPPATIFLLRVIVMTIFFGIMAARQTNLWLSVKAHAWIMLSAVIATVMMISRFYGFRDSGLVVTSTVWLITPALVYKGSAIFLHEKISRRQLYAFAGMLIAITCAVLLNGR